MDYILVERLGEVCYNYILAIIAISYQSYIITVTHPVTPEL